MKKEDLTVDLPNPHKQDIGIDLLKKVLKRAEISREVWLSVYILDAVIAGNSKISHNLTELENHVLRYRLSPQQAL